MAKKVKERIRRRWGKPQMGADQPILFIRARISTLEPEHYYLKLHVDP
jgi:hypothetical protein